MRIIEIIYITFAVTAVMACLPQIHHLLRRKSSDEFKVASWMMWLSSQVVATIYMLSIQAYLAAIISSAWMLFYVTMVVLILYYRRYPGGRQQLAEVAVMVEP